MYPLLTPGYTEQETKITSLILEASQAQKILLLGSTLMQYHTKSVFATHDSSCTYLSHYFILVLIDQEDKDCNNTIQDKIENKCRAFIPVTAIVLDITRYNDWLQKGHPFVCKVYKLAVVLHDTGNIPLAEPSNIDEHRDRKTSETYYNAGINKVQEFLAGADLYRIRQQNKMAAFMLQQAAEHALHTLLRITTGLYVSTHNIDKLIRYCSMVTYKLSRVFPLNTDKEKHLFKLLQTA